MGLVNGRPGEFTTLQLCNVLWIPASASSSSAVGWLTAPRPLRSQTGRSGNSQIFNFAMFWGLVQATLGSSSSVGGWWAPLLRLINEQLGYSQFRTLQCFGDCRLPIRVLLCPQCAMAAAVKDLEGCEIHNSSTLQCLGRPVLIHRGRFLRRLRGSSTMPTPIYNRCGHRPGGLTIRNCSTL